MKRNILLPIFAAAVLQISAQTWDKSHLDRVKENIGSPFYTEYLSLLIKEADALLDAVPLSVMDKTKVAASGDRHDYLSQARYF